MFLVLIGSYEEHSLSSLLAGISASPLKDDIMKWTAVMFGPVGAPQRRADVWEPWNELQIVTVRRGPKRRMFEVSTSRLVSI